MVQMKRIKANYGWVIVMVLAVLPLIPFGDLVFSLDRNSENLEEMLGMLYHISGEFSIRWMTAVLFCTPFYILFGVTNLFVRQAMGIATACWSIIHFMIFIWGEGLLETFHQFNYTAGFVAVLTLIPLLFTSNRKAMHYLKENWKKLQQFAYLALLLSLLHVALIDKAWTIYAIICGFGFLLRIPLVKSRVSNIRKGQK